MARRKRYDRRAARVYGSLIDPVVAPLRSAITHICREEGASRVLDVACATGAQCRRLAHAGIQVTGVDLSEAMIAAARRRARPGTEYILGSAFDLPFPDASFDAVLLSLALHEHPEAERVGMLREALRVLRPAGLLLVADYQPPSCAALHPAWAIARLIENVAGAEHREGFWDFVRRGGIDGLLSRHGLVASRGESAVFGIVRVAIVRPGAHDLNPMIDTARANVLDL